MASGDILAIFTPLANEPPAANFATLDIRNSHPVLDFDATTDESALFTGLLAGYSSSGATGITVDLYVAASSGTSGGSRWDVSIERLSGLDIDSDSFAAAQSATIAANGTSGIYTKGSIAFTDGAQMDSVAAGEPFRIKVTRDADHANDDLTGDAELLMVVVRET